MMDYKGIATEFNPGLTFPNYLTRNRLLNGIAKYIPLLKGELMDFGCGAKPYRSLFTVDKYVGVDYESPGHPHLNEEIDVYYDGKHIPFEDEHFDAVFTSEVFEHIFNLDEIIKEINRVMKTGGIILMTCPFSICEHEVPNDYARYTSFALKYFFEKNGFEIIHQDKTGNSVEVVFQLWTMYIHQHILPYIKNIPVVRTIFKLFTYTVLNCCAILFSKILPDRKDLYLNNIVVAKKIKTVS